MKYRPFMDLTDDEVKFIIAQILQPKRIENIERDTDLQEIVVSIVSDWKTQDDDGNEEEVECFDDIVLTEKDIRFDFSSIDGDHLQYKQYLLMKGCHYLLKDNPYISQ